MNKIKQVYEIEKRASKVSLISYDTLESFLQTMNGIFDIICWQHQGVYRGRIEDKKIKWYKKEGEFRPPSNADKYWQRARIFNEQQEYQIFVSKEGIMGRHRLDGEGEVKDVIKSSAVIRSIIVKPEDQNTSDKEFQGIQLINYLDYDKVGKVKVADMRFVNFKIMKNGK